MAQATDYSLANQTGANFRAELNSILAAVVSQNSGSTAPSTTYAYQWWIDNGVSPALLKLRNGANSAWITIGDVTLANLGLLTTTSAASTYAPLASPTFTGTVTIPGGASISGYLTTSTAASTYLALAGGTLTGNVTLNGQSDVRFADADSSNWVALQAPSSITTNFTLSLPSADGAANTALVTDGAGSLSFTAVARPGVANAFTGANTFTNATGQIFRQAATQDGVLLRGRAGGTTSLTVEIIPTTLTASRTVTLPDSNTSIPIATQTLTFSGPTAARTYTLPDANSTLVSLDATQTLTSKTLTDPTIIGTIIEDVFTITDAAAFEIDPANGSVQLITLGANRTPKGTNFAAGESVTLMVDDGTAYTLTWTDATFGTSGVKWTGGVAPTLGTTGYTVIQLWKVGTQVYGSRVGVA